MDPVIDDPDEPQEVVPEDDDEGTPVPGDDNAAAVPENDDAAAVPEDDNAPLIPEDDPAALEKEEIVIPDDTIVILDDIEVVPDDVIPEDEIEDEDDENDPKRLSDFVEVDVDENGVKKPKQVILTKDMMKRGLSQVTRILGRSEYAYSCFDGQNLDLTNIDMLRNYPHLKSVDLTKNRIRDCKVLSSAQHLIVLVLNDNRIQGFDAIPDLPYLQTVGVNGNKLRKLEGMPTNSYKCVQLSFNRIKSLRGLNEKSCPFVTILELRGNHLPSLKGLSLPALEQLFVADNNLTHFDGLSGCPQLQLLHARDNKISSLEYFPCLPALEYVNLRNNQLEEFTETKHLGNSPNIKVLLCMGNPISELDNYREEIIGSNQNLQRLDKEPVTEEELAQAVEMLNDIGNGDIFGEAKRDLKVDDSDVKKEKIVKKPGIEERTLKGLEIKKNST